VLRERKCDSCVFVIENCSFIHICVLCKRMISCIIIAGSFAVLLLVFCRDIFVEEKCLPVSLPDWPPQGSWLGHWSSSDFNVQKGTHLSDLSASVVSP